jgi:hypothetical protein
LKYVDDDDDGKDVIKSADRTISIDRMTQTMRDAYFIFVVVQYSWRLEIDSNELAKTILEPNWAHGTEPNHL